MSGIRTFTTLAAAMFGVLVVSAPPASAADPVSDAVLALGSANLYVDPGVKGMKIEQESVASAIPVGVKIAILPTSAGSATALATQIGKALDPSGAGLTVGVLTADSSSYAFGAGSSAYCAGYAGEKAKAAEAANRDELRSTHDVTALLKDFALSVATGPKAHTSACGASAGGGGAKPPASEKKSDSGGSAWPWIVGIGVVGGGGMGGLIWYRRRQKKRELDLARAKVMPYYDRLANEVNTLDPKDNATARQAISDASERFSSAGSQLAMADSVEGFAQARRTTLEGLYAAVTARKALGLDPGPPLPSIDGGGGEQLNDAREVTVQGQTFQGYPSYTPGAPHYFGGGYGVPGGWYATPFWETLLIGSVLTGGFGGGGFGSGYDSGYQTGYDAGQNAADNADAGQSTWGGGDWGGGGGGDWGGSGGGDWGGGGDSGGSDSGGSW